MDSFTNEKKFDEESQHDFFGEKIKSKKLEIRETSFYVRSVFLTFTFIWIIIIVLNKFYTSLAVWVLLIPFAIFLLGFMNADETANTDIESDVFSVTFITIGIIVSMPLLSLFNKEKTNEHLNHVIFLAMISTLLSYLHIWTGKKNRHVCKVIRSCLETYAICLYIFAITIFFVDE